MDFNSHAHVERDSSSHSCGTANTLISTHTLTWSVTFQTEHLRPHQRDFNSHAHVERDGAAKGAAEQVNNFNSHAHVERDGRTLGAL